MERIRNWTLVGAIAIIGVLLLAACGADPTATPTATSPPNATATPTPSAFDLLISRAAAGNGTIRYGLEGVAPEIIKAKEAAFEARFGIPIKIESEPGHASRDVPVKIIESAASGRGVVDMVFGANTNFMKLFTGGHLAKPDWDAIHEGFPLSIAMRENIAPISGPNGTELSDYCMHLGMSSWVLVYNTLNVTPAEIDGITLDDLTTPVWKDRIAWDARARGLFVLPLADGWSEDRMRIFAHNFGANGAKLISGGSNGIVQTLIQGEADIALASATTANRNIKAGAPLALAFPGMVLGGYRVSCPVSPSVNDRSLAQLYWAWEHFDGNYISSLEFGGGEFRIYPGEEGKFPLVDLAMANGITQDDLVFPATAEEVASGTPWRKIGIAALKAGVESGEMISQ
jgi:ABC-type Fe3+ transport system substrate-binding protein